MRKAVSVIAVFSTVGSVILLIIMGVALGRKAITWWNFIAYILGVGVNLLLLWALADALTRIEYLEDKKREIEASQRKLELRLSDCEKRKEYGSVESVADTACSNSKRTRDDIEKEDEEKLTK